jgi:hypothetical protein
MATSTNYLWAEPNDSDLVKNGALAIRTLGNAIDTSVWNVGYGQAGKNKIINGDFGIWQRGTTFTSPALFGYAADRWQTVCSGTVGGLVLSQQAFTAGAAPVAGYEGQFFLRQVTTSQTGGTVQALATRLEDVRDYAGQTVTLSFWAKADAARTWSSRLIQSFGSGGSADVTTSGASLSVTTAWARFTQTFTVPSISGKTIGAGSYLYVIIDGVLNTGQTMDIWGVQLEYGSVATPFQTASGGSPQAELAMCQRYYYRITNDGASSYTNISGIAYSSTGFGTIVPLKVTMRVTPTSLDYASLRSFDLTNVASVTAATLSAASPNVAAVDFTSSGLTQYRPYVIIGNTVPSYIGFSAEL